MILECVAVQNFSVEKLLILFPQGIRYIINIDILMKQEFLYNLRGKLICVTQSRAHCYSIAIFLFQSC